jgi:hypothetical protein
MALSQEQLKQLAVDICATMDALDRGMTPDELRDLAFLAGDKAGYLATVDAAVAFHSLPQEVRDPGYRKGTAMQPAKWADCVWRPTP